MDDSVAASDVSRDHFRTVDAHCLAIYFDIDSLAVESNCSLDLDNIRSHDFAAYHVVSQNCS